MSTTTDALGNLIVSDPSTGRPRVLLYEPDEAGRFVVEQALGERCVLRIAADIPTLTARLASSSFDVLVLSMWDATVAATVAAAPATARRPRIVHYGEVVPELLVEAAEKGLQLAHVDSIVDLGGQILAFTHPRSAMERHPVSGLLLHVAIGAHPLLEISNDGFSFHLDPRFGLEGFLPGEVLHDIEIRRRDAVALAGVSATIRHLAVDGNGYRVGCEMFAKPRVDPSLRSTFVRDRALSAGMLRAALRGAGLLVQTLDGPGPTVYATSGSVDLASRSMTLSSPPHHLAQYDVVRGRFEIGGSLYRFTTTVITVKPLTLRMPSMIEVTQQRSSGRYQPSITDPIPVRLTSPLLADPIDRAIRDVSSTGFSIEIDPQLDLFPCGMRFTKVELRVGNETFTCRGRVRNLSFAADQDAMLRCGVEIEDLPDARRLRLGDVIMRSRFPGLLDGGEISFQALWDFFIESRFVYPEKQKALEPLMPEIRNTFEALALPSDIYKGVLARDEGRVIGYVSGVRAYRHTWMSQHLCALQGHLAGAQLNLGQAEYFGQNTDLDYFKIFFRPNNLWPARVFGGFARNVTDTRLSDLRVYDYYQVPLDWRPNLPLGADVQVRNAGDDDLALVERYFVGAERGVLLRADDLTREGLTLDALDERYLRVGLSRRRRVLMAHVGGPPIAFALVELSAPGLNLSELLSSFRIFHLPDVVALGSPTALAARAALVQAALTIYRHARRPMGVGLGLLGERAEYARIGIASNKQYSAWTCHRALYQRFTDHVDRLVRTLAARAERQRKRPS